jgi:hypothetical protein
LGSARTLIEPSAASAKRLLTYPRGSLSKVSVDPHRAQNPHRLPGDELNSVIRPGSIHTRRAQRHENLDPRTAVLAATFAMAQSDPFRLPSGHEAHRAARTAGLELIVPATKLSAPGRPCQADHGISIYVVIDFGNLAASHAASGLIRFAGPAASRLRRARCSVLPAFDEVDELGAKRAQFGIGLEPRLTALAFARVGRY